MPDELEKLRENMVALIESHINSTNWADELSHQILSYLASQGVMIQTPHGLMMLSDLIKKEADK